MRKKDSDSCSSISGTSKNSGEKGKKTPRFSLRNLFYRRHSSRKSSRSLSSNSNAEVEVRSVQSLQVPPAVEKDLEASSSGLSCEEGSGLSRLSKDSLECPLCLVQQPKECFPSVMTCHHRSCRDCLQQYLRIEITESRVNIACPECSEKFHPNDIESILGDLVLLKKYETFMLRRVLVLDPDARWCPAPDCGFAVVASGCAGCPKLKCERPGCDTFFCYHCKQYWHPNQTCDAARAERSSNLRSSVSYSHDGSNSDIKPCPRCGAFIIKLDDGSCNHMTCAVCGAEFCWLCMKEISDLHYLSPSGCTFWGKKPWSRKKKILWQLGTMVGAPVGIALVAGIAVPAMLIGIPVWVGRKLHARYEDSPRYKKNLIITAGVTGAILVSPLLAGIAVGFGVPILLGYVYAVVPISLCRSGGCGVTTTDSGGVRFEFEEDNEAPAGATGGYSAAAPADGHSVETASHHNVANPSIGPSIGEMSVAMTNSLSASGSHMDRVGALRDESDRDSASNRAIAGISLSGSLSGMGGQSSYQHRMEIQAEVASGSNVQKRASLSSESANFSLDAKSATVSFGDDASTKALAGSICTRDKDNVSAIVPSHEVHLDVTGTSARYLHSSASQGLDASSRPVNTSAMPSGQGSPTSTRSVNFVGEEVIEYTVPCSKRYKRQSLSVGDSIYEHAEVSGDGLGALGLASNMTNLDAIPGGPSPPTGLASAPPQISASCSLAQSSPRSVTSADSLLDPRPCSSRSFDGVAGGITQVENDRPINHLVPCRLRMDSTSTDSTSVETVSMIMPDSSAASCATPTNHPTSLGAGDCMGAVAAAGVNPNDCLSVQRNMTCYYSHGCSGSMSGQSSQSSSVSSSHALCAKLSCETDDSASTSSS